MDSRRRHKKPEQQLYVPKPVAQAQAEREFTVNERLSSARSLPNVNRNNGGDHHHQSHRRTDQRNGNIHNSHNGSAERLNVKSKRFSANRKPSAGGSGDHHSDHFSDRDNRHLSPVAERLRYAANRDRQTSEPRVMAPAGPMNRIRDTRSVEPAGNAHNNYQSGKMLAKPPSGRRHSTIGLEPGKMHKQMMPNLDKLPPRLRNKYMLENNIDPSTYQGPEDTWDGASVTFRGSDNHHPNTSGYNQPDTRHNYRPVAQYSATLPHPHHNQPLDNSNQPPAVWSYTIPNTRVRGRGRLRPDTTADTNQVLRSLTPDRVVLLSPCNSRPCTPPPFGQRNKSGENINSAGDASSQTPTPSKSVQSPDSGVKCHSSPLEHSNVSSSSELGSPTKIPQVNTIRDDAILDWSEEVELNEKLEQEALSDCMTRCSSVASLSENSHKPHKNKRNRNQRNRSSSRNRRDKSREKHSEHEDTKQTKKRQQSGKERSESRERLDGDGFKMPDTRNGRRRKNSFRERSNERRHDRRSQNSDSRHSSLDRGRRDSSEVESNWRDEIRMRCSVERKLDPVKSELDAKELEKSKPGIIVLPQSPVDKTRPPVLQLPDSTQSRPLQRPKPQASGQQRTLFDPNNPHKPIVVTASTRLPNLEPNMDVLPPEVTTTSAGHTQDQFGNVRPGWYDPYSDNFRLCKFPHHLLDVQRADLELQFIINTGALMHSWNGAVATLRQFFRESLEYLLVKDIKFCQTENVENHYWKLLYYNIIEIMRKSITADAENKEQYKSIILSLIDEGTKYFERLLEVLEDTYKFKLDTYLGVNKLPPSKGLGFIGLALVSAQKMFLFLGDLARYKEQVNETSNYGRCRQWYIKAHEINPKNGRPYNQLALLAVYARRKLDAVYYYMRSLMSSNPVQSAKESLISLFDENRKKYEQGERKRREEKAKLQMKEKESAQNIPSSLRREIWVHPEGGRRLHRTTSAAQETVLDSEEEDLYTLSSVEVNKRFITSYLHVHGKLITKIGMETFQHAALQMLREFRVLLQQSPVPLTSNRFLHLLALNMFAIDSTQLKVPELEPGCRSEVQERALVVSLQMFNVILERSLDLLQDHVRQQERQQPVQLCQDLQIILPAVKVWCDWMLCHSSVWNPPPSCSDYRIGPSSDTWGRLATLMNLLEKLQYQKPPLETSSSNGNEVVRLPEDATMCGFTPLMYNIQEAVYVREQVDLECAQMCVRIGKILFFGTVFLCGLEPPVLKLQKYETYSEYISVVRTSSRDSPSSPVEICHEHLLLENFSGDEEEVAQATAPADNTSGEIRTLLDRKVELEKRHRTQELHRQHVQAILQQSVVSVEIEVRPRYLVPDTNCFIDYLERLQTLARTHGPQPFTLMVPLTVLGELEGLARGGKSPAPAPRLTLDPEHMLRVAEAARKALEFLHCRNPAVKCLTTRGTVLASSTFTSEDEDKSQDVGPRNDDRILATCLSLCRNVKDQHAETSELQVPGGPRRIYREVVLLTEDRNLRVKALARDVPVRELPDFLQWANLG
ncbi:Smg6 [Carabus blaptoides fortunei]